MSSDEAAGGLVQRPGDSPKPPRGSAGTPLLLAVLLLVGGALGWAAYRVSAGRQDPEPPRGDVVVLSKGERVDLSASAVKGKYTIYDFYADWCPPCRTLDVQLRQLAARHDNVAIRKIDILDWTSPVVEQHGITDLPHMILYGPDGEKLGSGTEVYSLVARLFGSGLEQTEIQ